MGREENEAVAILEGQAALFEGAALEPRRDRSRPPQSFGQAAALLAQHEAAIHRELAGFRKELVDLLDAFRGVLQDSVDASVARAMSRLYDETGRSLDQAQRRVAELEAEVDYLRRRLADTRVSPGGAAAADEERPTWRTRLARWWRAFAGQSPGDEV